jgi:hypothetical protein
MVLAFVFGWQVAGYLKGEVDRPPGNIPAVANDVKDTDRPRARVRHAGGVGFDHSRPNIRTTGREKSHPAAQQIRNITSMINPGKRRARP